MVQAVLPFSLFHEEIIRIKNDDERQDGYNNYTQDHEYTDIVPTSGMFKSFLVTKGIHDVHYGKHHCGGDDLGDIQF